MIIRWLWIRERNIHFVAKLRGHFAQKKNDSRNLPLSSSYVRDIYGEMKTEKCWQYTNFCFRILQKWKVFHLRLKELRKIIKKFFFCLLNSNWIFCFVKLSKFSFMMQILIWHCEWRNLLLNFPISPGNYISLVCI